MASRSGIQVMQTQRLALTGSLQTALRVLRMDAAGLTRYLEEQAAETPALALTPALPALGDWLPRWSGLYTGSSRGDGRFGLGGLDQAQADLPDPGPSLMQHVIEALPALVPAGPDRRIALALAETLEPTGWLGRPLDQIAQGLGISPEAVEAVLLQVQHIEPAGLFARDLAECLRLQARDAGLLQGALAGLIDHLPLVAEGRWSDLSALLGQDEAALRQAFATLRSFNPKPGTGFAAVASPLPEPDILARRGDKGWVVSLNRSSLPSLEIEEGQPGGARARAVLRLVESRNATLLAVAQAVLEHQCPALEAGPVALRPLTMQELADRLGLHKSTVSRVVAGTSVDTPLGTWWLRALFSPDMGAGTGAAALRARLAQLVAEEDKSAPHSDEALAGLLSDGGAVVARRTVAKYRAALRIAPAHRRRQRRSGA